MGDRLQGKVAIVTGAASGIGRASAVRFAAEGAAVVCADVQADDLERTASEAREAGGRATAVTTDVSSATAVQGLVDATVAEHGTIDVLYSVAGVISLGTAEDTEEDEWARILGTNLTGLWLCSKYVLPHMVRAGRGSIINQASVGGLEGIANLAAYCTSKAGVIGLTRQMAVDFGPSGIRVNAIAPGTILTPMVQGIMDPSREKTWAEVAEILEPMAATYPLGRIGTRDEVANAALFLASDESSYITGAVLSVDAGKLAG